MIKSRSLFIVLLFTGLVLTQCGPPKDTETGYPIVEQNKVLIVEPRLEKCSGFGKNECFVINGKKTYETIRGFRHKDGVWTKMLVDKYERTDRPQENGQWGYIFKKKLDEIDIDRDRPEPDILCSFYEGRWIEDRRNCRFEDTDLEEAYCVHITNCR